MIRPPRSPLASAFTPVFVLALAAGAAAHVVAPIVRPPVPARVTPTTIQLGATSAAFAVAPPVNQARAQFAYRDALARYRAGDLAGARASAAVAQGLLGAPAAAGVPDRGPAPAGWFGGSGSGVSPLAPGPGANAPLVARSVLGAGIAGSAVTVDEDELVARSRSALASCVARTPERLPEARAGFAAVWAAHAAGDLVREREAARALIARCGVLF